MNPYSIPPLLAGMLALLLGFFVLLNNRKDRLNRFFCAICSAVFIWLACYSLGYSVLNPSLALFIFRLGYVGVSLSPVLCMHFHLEFVGIHRTKLILLVLYVTSALFILLSHHPLFFTGVRQFFWGFYPEAGPLYPLFIVYFGGVLLASSCLLLYQLLKGRIRGDYANFRYQQLKYLALGFVIAYGGFVDFIAKFGIEFYPFGYANIILFVIILSYAMLRHRLLDVETMMQIFQQNKLATLGLLSAGLNHEIRNPLYVIRGYAESYLENQRSGIFRNVVEAEEKSREILHKTIEQAERAVDIMKRFSSFAKISQNGHEKQEVSIEDCVRNVLDFLSHELVSKKIKIDTRLADGLRIFANKREVEEIVFNIILNACQAMKEGGKIEISSIEKGDSCLILIRDTGSGIPRHLHKKIFEPFYSGKTEGGTGLGLFICQFLTEQNGGRIQINSKVGQGTVFILEFPLTDSVAKTMVTAGSTD